MEKIYMEEQNQNQNKNKKRRSLTSSTSIMMSFILAFVAIISIVAYGFGQVSFAIPEESTTPFPETITTGTESDESYKIKGNIATTQIALHRTTENKYIYCIESEIDIAEDTQYQKDKEITDNGLLFLLNYLLSEDFEIVDERGQAVPEKAKGWIIQSAIWTYQFDVKAANSYGTTMTAEAAQGFRNEKAIFAMNDFMTNIFETSGGTIYDTCKLNGTSLPANDTTITGLIAKAERIHNGQESWNAFTVTASKKSDTISLTSDDKYYQTDVVTINGTEGFLGFKIDASSAPKGTMILNTNGEELTGDKLDNLVNGTQFVVRVPVDSITEENKQVSIQITGAFKGDMAYSYSAPERQKVAFTGKVTKHVVTGISFNFDYTPDVPDTSLTTAQSIYFVGLIILLAGVGIIYANIKPKEEN